MATTTKRTKAKRNIYLKRKARSNARIKAQVFDVRIIVQKSNKYISAQAVSASGEIIWYSTDSASKAATKTERAFDAWKDLAAKLSTFADKKIIFDRNGHIYHGRVKAFAEGLREWGINL